MSLTLESFWALMDFVIAQVVELFTFLDTIVIIDSPRLTFYSVIISIIFLWLLIKVILWLVGRHSSGMSRWEYISQDDGLREPKQLDGSFLKENRRIQMQGNMVHYYDNKSPDEMEMWSPGEIGIKKRGGRW